LTPAAVPYRVEFELGGGTTFEEAAITQLSSHVDVNHWFVLGGTPRRWARVSSSPVSARRAGEGTER